MNDELSQKWRDIQDKAIPGNRSGETGRKIQSPHEHGSRHRDRMDLATWNPNRSEWGHNPNPLGRPNCHDSSGRKNDLILVMKVRGHNVTIAVVVRQGR